MGRNVNTWSFDKALKAEGFELPKECADVNLVFPVDGVLMIKYDCFVTHEDLAKIGRAMIRMAEEVKSEER